jgi:hypothetical protein
LKVKKHNDASDVMPRIRKKMELGARNSSDRRRKAGQAAFFGGATLSA